MNRDEREMWREALRATSLGWDLALPIFGGVLVGYLLDQTLGTRYVFTLSFLVLGIATGFYNVIRSIQQVDETSRQRDRRKKKGRLDGGSR
jgi:F0F1-type ATP synthase assembly protein I